MNKFDLIDEIVSKTGLAKKDVDEVLKVMLDCITNALVDGKEVTLTGFGTFSSKFRHARGGVNPRKPSERIQIPAVTVPKFKAGKALKDSLKNVKGENTSMSEEQSSENPQSISG